MSRPWMPLYVGDYLADTRRLSTIEHGAYMLLIMDYWQNGSLPRDDESLAQIVGLNEKEWAKAKKRVEALFLPGWKHKRIEEELVKAAEKSKSAKASAEASWNSPKRGDRSPNRNANADADMVQTHSEGICGVDAHARVSLTQSHSLDNSFPSSTISEGEGIKNGFEEFWELFPNKGQSSRQKAFEAWRDLTLAERVQAVAALPALKLAKPTTHPISPERWLREKRFAAHAEACGRPKIAMVKVDRISPQGDAWEAFSVATKGKGVPWSNGAWHFAAEWPPPVHEAAQ